LGGQRSLSGGGVLERRNTSVERGGKGGKEIFSILWGGKGTEEKEGLCARIKRGQGSAPWITPEQGRDWGCTFAEVWRGIHAAGVVQKDI